MTGAVRRWPRIVLLHNRGKLLADEVAKITVLTAFWQPATSLEVPTWSVSP